VEQSEMIDEGRTALKFVDYKQCVIGSEAKCFQERLLLEQKEQVCWEQTDGVLSEAFQQLRLFFFFVVHFPCDGFQMMAFSKIYLEAMMIFLEKY
jgi:hypothetical protein